MLKNYNYILTIMLYPFILLLSFLISKKFIQGSLYLYLIIFMIILFIPSFIMSLYNAVDDIFINKNKKSGILIFLFSIFYLPIYYTKYVSKSEKYLGYVLCLLSITLSVLTFDSINDKLSNWLTEVYRESFAISDSFTYTSNNNLFTINVSKDFRCNSHDVGDYVISCDRLDDDSFIGVYSYDITDYDDEEILVILTYHINQSEEYVKESGYDSEINKIDDIFEINYYNMSILLTQKNYVVNDSNYSLIIIKEMPKELENIDEYQKMIETIHFIPYNEEVSS